MVTVPRWPASCQRSSSGELTVPCACLQAEDGTTREWRSAVLPQYARRTRQLEALIAGAYLAGTNTRRVQRALGALFRGAVGKDVVNRAWRKVKVDWEAWGRRDLAGEDIVHLMLDGTVLRVRLDRKATSARYTAFTPGGPCWMTWPHAGCGPRSS